MSTITNPRASVSPRASVNPRPSVRPNAPSRVQRFCRWILPSLSLPRIYHRQLRFYSRLSSFANAHPSLITALLFLQALVGFIAIFFSHS